MPNSATQLRQKQLLTWLNSISGTYELDLNSLESASTDASFRSYHRIKANNTRFIVMDAPPAKENND